MIGINNGLITKAVEDFFEKLSDFENKLSDLQLSSGADLRVINTNLQRLKSMIEAQPKQIVNEKRILLFPETYKQEFYKIIFGSVVKSFAMLIVTLFAFFFLKDLLIQHENEKFKTSWELVIPTSK